MYSNSNFASNREFPIPIPVSQATRWIREHYRASSWKSQWILLYIAGYCELWSHPPSSMHSRFVSCSNGHSSPSTGERPNRDRLQQSPKLTVVMPQPIRFGGAFQGWRGQRPSVTQERRNRHKTRECPSEDRGLKSGTAGCGPACPVVWEEKSRYTSPYPVSGTVVDIRTRT